MNQELRERNNDQTILELQEILTSYFFTKNFKPVDI